MKVLASLVLSAVIVSMELPFETGLSNAARPVDATANGYAIYCTKGRVNDNPVSAPVLLKNKDVVTRDGDNDIEFTGDEFATISVSGSGARVEAVEKTEAGVTAICLDLDSGTLTYTGDPLRKSVGGGGRKYIVRRRGFSVGAVGTKYYLACSGTSSAYLTVESGQVCVIPPNPYGTPQTYGASFVPVLLDPNAVSDW